MQLKWSDIRKLCCNHYFQLAAILILSFTVRLYRINYPLLDWHSFRQADTASVTYRYTQEGIDLLRPRYHDLSHIQSGQPNPEGWRMTEFPFVNGFIAVCLMALPMLDLVIFSRFISILASIGTLLFFYWLVQQLIDKNTALISILFLGFLPFSIFYSRVILPEPFMLFFGVGSLTLFTAFLKQGKKIYWWLSWLFLALSLLLKPFIAFWAPVYLVILILFDTKFYKNIYLYLYPVLSLAPLLLWRRWISNFPAGIPASDWLFNVNNIRWRPAWFRWLFWERLGKLMTGIVGLLLLAVNVLRRNRVLLIIAAWWLGIIAYFSVIATGNIQHDYYQVLILPCLALTLARGSLILYQKINQFLKNKIAAPKLISSSLITILIMISFCLSWLRVKGFFNVNYWEYHQAGQEANLLLPETAQIIAPAHGDTMFLFQTRRNGWPIGGEINNKIEQGATHYITINFDEEAQELEEKYTTVKKTGDYMIIDLTNPRNDND